MTHCREGVWQGRCGDVSIVHEGDMLVVEECGIYTNDESIMAFGIMDLSVGVAWYCCGFCYVFCNC